MYLDKTQDITSGYKKLNNVLGTHYEEVDVSTLLQNSQIGDLSKLPWIRAFQRAAYGFGSTKEKDTKDVPVRYVSLEENKHNNATTKDGRPKRFSEQEWIAGRSPQPLWITDLATVPDVFLAEAHSEECDNSSESSKKDNQSSHKSKHKQSKNRQGDRRADAHAKGKGSGARNTQHDAPTSHGRHKGGRHR